MNVGGKLTFIVSVDKGGLEKCTLSEILFGNLFEYGCAALNGYGKS